jgi:hypothetical protein
MKYRGLIFLSLSSRIIHQHFIIQNKKFVRQEWRENLTWKTFLLKSVTKQHIKIKIITYLYLITKAVKR